MQEYIEIIRPPFLKNKKQFSPEEAKLNADIASARVHVERSIQRVKMFKILKEKISWKLVPYIEDIVAVVTGLVNLKSPLLADDKF